MSLSNRPAVASFPPPPVLPEPWRSAYSVAEKILLDLAWAVHFSCKAVGKAPANTLEAFVVRMQPTPTDAEKGNAPCHALGCVAELWILSDVADPRRAYLEQALPHLKQFRGTRGSASLAIGPISGASLAECLLQWAVNLTHFCETVFDGKALVNIVQRSFPRDVEADPWDVQLILSGRGHPPELVQFMFGRRPFSEFVRRLMNWDIVPAMNNMKAEELCGWLCEYLSEVDFPRLRSDLGLEFACLAAEQPRVTVDLLSNTIILDGKTFTGLSPNSVRAFKVYSDHPGSVIPSKKAITLLEGCNHTTTLARWLDDLPEELRKCIKGREGSGRYIELPPID
jgi:hypothetical protein